MVTEIEEKKCAYKKTFQGEGSGRIIVSVKVGQDHLEGRRAFSIIIFTLMCSYSLLHPDPLAASFKAEASK